MDKNLDNYSNKETKEVAMFKEALKIAISQEDHFVKFYTSAAERSEGSAKQLFESLVKEEQKHKEKLENVDPSSFDGMLDKENSQNLDAPSSLDSSPSIAEKSMLAPTSDFKTLKEIFEFAINAESNAHETYKMLAAVSHGSLRELFNTLAEEESEHEALLKKELSSTGL